MGDGADARRGRRPYDHHTLTSTGELPMAMTFGMHLGHVGGPIAEMRKLWRFADANGFEAISTMTAIALDTKHVRVGSLVICVNYRNPGVLAKAICTIDHLSGGRVELGMGAGWHENEYRGYSIPFEPTGVP